MIDNEEVSYEEAKKIYEVSVQTLQGILDLLPEPFTTGHYMTRVVNVAVGVCSVAIRELVAHDAMSVEQAMTSWDLVGPYINDSLKESREPFKELLEGTKKDDKQ